MSSVDIIFATRYQAKEFFDWTRNLELSSDMEVIESLHFYHKEEEFHKLVGKEELKLFRSTVAQDTKLLKMTGIPEFVMRRLIETNSEAVIYELVRERSEHGLFFPVDTFDQWVNYFEPQKVEDGSGSYDGYMYEAIWTDPSNDAHSHVWTLIEDKETPYIVPGRHYQDALGYFYTKHPWVDGQEDVKVPFTIGVQEAKHYCMDFVEQVTEEDFPDKWMDELHEFFAEID